MLTGPLWRAACLPASAGRVPHPDAGLGTRESSALGADKPPVQVPWLRARTRRCSGNAEGVDQGDAEGLDRGEAQGCCKQSCSTRQPAQEPGVSR